VISLSDKAHPADHACAVSTAYKGGDYQVPKDFDLEGWRLQQPWDYLAHPPVEVVVRLGGALARSARTLLPKVTFGLADDGRREGTFSVRNLDGLVRQLLAWGPEAELMAPPEGRALARAMLERLGGVLAREVAP
jgi:proteasome accessory factor B